MKHEDKLPVLSQTAQQAPQTGDKTAFDEALSVLRGALEADLRQLPRQDSPAARPAWRAGGDPGKARADRAGAATPAQREGRDRDERNPLGRRITAIHLPRFAMERWQKWAAGRNDAPPDDLPVALAVEGPHGPVIHATNRPAEQAGVHRGARVVDMRALCPELRVDYADLAGDRAALERLMLWARRWCPWTAVDGDDGLVLDTTGSDHLMGGEAAMLRGMEEELSRLGLSAALAVAPTHGAAWALARFGRVREVCAPDRLALRMGPMPVRALRLRGDAVQLLNRLGLKTVGDLAAVPRLSLARRFNRAELPDNPLLRLDQMMGRLAEPVSPPEEPPRFAVQSRLADPVADPSDWVPGLCDELCGGLAAAGMGARQVRLTVYRTDGEVSSVSLRLAQASRDGAHMARLFDGRLDRIDPGFGFDLITLEAGLTEPVDRVQTRIEGGSDDGTEVARLMDRIGARLGPGTLRSPALSHSHIPERAERWPHAPAGRAAATAPAGPDRPLHLFDTPEEIRVLYAVPEGPPAQFVWRRVPRRVARFSGPERIAPEWWADSPGTRLRDYYKVESDHGLRLWIYRDGVLGDQRGHMPQWFVHGVFR
ncbi:DNA polymerase Y family protein [Loktanella sp. IMCC34160]|uniref:Y-family DNA polymerase n=1 Tax=Loktanella sp. IMCC34160 TaxID=2510646 RepID=UPI00101BD6AF|nr:DNA polymerase Y family protein [Loktanella sp. IMCC34160]